jgi:type I site-specific restriction endonuclease
MPTEADARIVVDRLLRQAGWDIEDKSQVSTEEPAADGRADYLRDYPCTILYGGKRSLESQIVVGTLETIAGQLGPGGFGHAYFDLVVTDECHRSIYNAHRATLAHFDAIHIGLTATPNRKKFWRASPPRSSASSLWWRR